MKKIMPPELVEKIAKEIASRIAVSRGQDQRQNFGGLPVPNAMAQRYFTGVQQPTRCQQKPSTQKCLQCNDLDCLANPLNPKNSGKVFAFDLPELKK